MKYQVEWYSNGEFKSKQFKTIKFARDFYKYLIPIKKRLVLLPTLNSFGKVLQQSKNWVDE